jgi:hypothetical protein
MATMNDTASGLKIAVDPDHGGLRLTVILLFGVLLVITYLIIGALVPSEGGLNLLAGIAALVVTVLILQQIEKLLKHHWPSGRAVEIDTSGVRVVHKGKVQSAIDANQQVNVLMWRFKIQRRSRVPKGWYVVACALEQEGSYVSAYTFMSPQQFDAMPASRLFTLLMGKKELQNQNAERDLRLAGQQRRLHTAETQRWMDGAEMSITDFENYVSHLQIQFPKWMPAN